MLAQSLSKSRCPQCNKVMEEPLIVNHKKGKGKKFVCKNCGSEWFYNLETNVLKRL